jgi:hypothetical protein
MENSTDGPQKVKNRTTLNPSTSLLGIDPKEMKERSQNKFI